MKVKFICQTVKWFDKVNGNTYHSNRITRCRDGKTIGTILTYGYGDHCRQTAFETMSNAKWLPVKYRNANVWLYERENDYPIHWIWWPGTKKQCIDNGIPH